MRRDQSSRGSQSLHSTSLVHVVDGCRRVLLVLLVLELELVVLLDDARCTEGCFQVKDFLLEEFRLSNRLLPAIDECGNVESHLFGDELVLLALAVLAIAWRAHGAATVATTTMTITTSTIVHGRRRRGIRGQFTPCNRTDLGRLRVANGFKATGWTGVQEGITAAATTVVVVVIVGTGVMMLATNTDTTTTTDTTTARKELVERLLEVVAVVLLLLMVLLLLQLLMFLRRMVAGVEEGGVEWIQ